MAAYRLSHGNPVAIPIANCGLGLNYAPLGDEGMHRNDVLAFVSL